MKSRGKPLDKISIAGFKSIREAEVELRPLNVLIGANGAGKSNFVAVFRLLHELINERLQLHVRKAGGADSLLHFGRKHTEAIRLELAFKRNGYICQLDPTAEDGLVFGHEEVWFRGQGYSKPYTDFLGSGQLETRLVEASRASPEVGIADHVIRAFQSWRLYHFHDTSDSAKVKQTGDLDDNEALRADAGNLAAFLYLLRERHEDHYRNIVETIRLVAPFFDDFRLRPDPLSPRKIRLEWQERGSDTYFGADALSDGTLRFICLATLLLQPRPPTTILLDEPELGLHPFALHILADLFQSTAVRTQLIVSTQSVTLVNQLEPEHIIVVDRAGSESTFRQVTEPEIASWMDDYALGELWEKNVLGGRPAG